MATPKKYNEFPAGTYDTSKIFLQADPVTGALEKINLPALASGNPFYCVAPNVNNNGTNPQTTAQIIIPANALPNTGDTIIFSGLGTNLTATGSKTLAFICTGIASITTNSTAQRDMELFYKIVRISPTQCISFGYWRSDGSFPDRQSANIVTYNVADPKTFQLRVTAGIANDIVTRFLSATIYKV